jgi:hypothetical protein
MGRLIKNTNDGRAETFSTILNRVRKPSFVDNGVYIGQVSKNNDNQVIPFKIEYEGNFSFQIMPDTTYSIIEGESYLQINHKSTDGHTSTLVPFFNDEIISNSNKPKLLYNANNPSQRLIPSTIDGNIINLPNMKNKSLTDIGFTNKEIRLGQMVDIGLRTTDTAIRIGESITNSSLTSVNISKNNIKSKTDRKHSMRFVAKDFNNVNIMTALRFLGRHDTRMVMLDRFGNMLYVPISFSESNKVIDPNLKTGSNSTDKIENIPNRITIKGIPIALNDSVIVTLNDTERQSGTNGEVIEGETILDATVNNSNAARRVGRQILRSNNLESGTIVSEGQINVTELRPGMTVDYGGTQHVITEITHYPMEKKSDIVLLTVDTGLEGVLQGINESMTMEDNQTNPSTFIQNIKENISMFGRLQIRTIVRVTQRGVDTTAFLIGGVKGNNTRGLIGKSGLPIGMNKSQEV